MLNEKNPNIFSPNKSFTSFLPKSIPVIFLDIQKENKFPKETSQLNLNQETKKSPRAKHSNKGSSSPPSLQNHIREKIEKIIKGEGFKTKNILSPLERQKKPSSRNFPFFVFF